MKVVASLPSGGRTQSKIDFAKELEVGIPPTPLCENPTYVCTRPDLSGCTYHTRIGMWRRRKDRLVAISMWESEAKLSVLESEAKRSVLESEAKRSGVNSLHLTKLQQLKGRS